MRYLRHAPLTVYLVLVLALAGILVLALTRPAPPRPVVRYGYAYNQQSLLALANQMTGLSPLAAHPGPALATWAEGVATLAGSDYQTRARAYGASDPLARDLHALRAAALALAANPRAGTAAVQAAYGAVYDRAALAAP